MTAAYALADGSSFAAAVGVADVSTGLPMTPSTRMLAASVGKSVVAAVVLDLVAEGTLALDEGIATWLDAAPWFTRLEGGDAITLRMLLQHTSGLYEDLESADHADRFLEQLTAEGYDPDTVSLPLLVEFALDHDPLFPPGTGFLYTDVNYLLVGLIIERATRSTYYGQATARILAPLGLANTEPSTRRVIAGLATGYLLPGNVFGLPEVALVDGALAYNPGIEWTGGGLVSSVEDLGRWARALFQGTALPHPYLADLLDRVPRGDGGMYGLGVRIGGGIIGEHYRLDGFIPGYRSRLVYYPDRGVAIAVQVNRDYGVDLEANTSRLAGVLSTDLR